MSAKRKIIISAEGRSFKNRRKAIDLEMKMKIIRDYEAGKKVKVIARDMALAHSTVSTILKDKDRVKEAAQTSTGLQAIITRQRKGLIHEMEKLLALWFDEQTRNGVPMSLLIIQAKARSIFETFKARQDGGESTETFTASHGWYQRFRRRFNLHARSTSSEVASAYVVAEYDSMANATNGDRIELEAQQNLAEVERMEEVQKKFTVTGLDGVFANVHAALMALERMDPNVERFTQVERQMDELLQCYREIYEEKKKLTKHTTLRRLFTKPPPTSTSISSPSSPLPGPSTVLDNSDDDTDDHEHFQGYDD